ncbi:putative toxin-antitoxin system toxin component, PIN family [Candidatus Woesearchaeota archaeon]|nr:putative toxin-antitoxin system toxin component, PIN family [Candidatus Woesearchaeota archaeon]
MRKLVLDTNILISALIKDSTTRKMIFHFPGELYFISFSKEEIQEYEVLLLRKTKKDKEEFERILGSIINKLIILNEKDVALMMEEAKKIMDKIDPDDTPFIAAALLANADIWSDDKHFEKQNKIKVWKTSEVYKIFIEDWEDWTKKMREKDKKRAYF